MQHVLALLPLFFLFLLFSPHVFCQIPVIIDTDIGSYVDDGWAIGLLIASPEVDIKLIVTSTQNTTQRTQILAKFLTEIGRSDIPIGKGYNYGEDIGILNEYASDFDINLYEGPIYEDGIQAMIDTIEAFPAITVVELSPASSFAQVIVQRPEMISRKVRVISMGGSIYQMTKEYNVADNVTASQIMYNQHYQRYLMLTAPLDTSALVIIEGNSFDRLVQEQNTNKLIWNLLEIVRIYTGDLVLINSTTIYDAQAALMVYSLNYLNVECLQIRVDQLGYTIIDNTNGTPILAATSWHEGGLQEWQIQVTGILVNWNKQD